MSDKENEINTMNAIVEAIKEEICNEKENARKKSEELERVLSEQSTLRMRVQRRIRSSSRFRGR